VRKFFLVVFLFALLIAFPKPVFATGEDCSPNYSLGSCNSPEVCIPWGQTQVLTCRKNSNFDHTDFGASHCPFNTSYNAPQQVNGETCYCLEPLDKGSPVIAVRDYSLCKPPGTNPPSFSPPTKSGGGGKLSCDIRPDGGYTKDNYSVLIDSESGVDTDSKHYEVVEGVREYDDLNTADIFAGQSGQKPWQTMSSTFSLTAGEHTLEVWGYDEKGAAKQHCTTQTITVIEGGSSLPKCDITYVYPVSSMDVPLPKGTKIKITVKFPKKDTKYKYKIEPIMNKFKGVESGPDYNQVLDEFELSNNPTLIIYSDDEETAICQSKDFVTISADSEGYQEEKDDPGPTAYPLPCADSVIDPKTNQRICTKISTGLGIDFGTDAVGFVQSVFGLILGLSGGIALILIIVSGYRLILIRGNPEKMQGVKDSLTSAVVGLLFIIFSLVILEVVGVEILKIPGFK
jgi:hypothetical protein